VRGRAQQLREILRELAALAGLEHARNGGHANERDKLLH
jgi:hypothetical protein